MPSRTNKQRQFVYSARRYLSTDKEFLRALDYEYVSSAEDERLKYLDMPRNGMKDLLLSKALTKIRDNLTSESDLTPANRILLLAMILPLLGPETPDNSPTRQGAEAALDAPEPDTLPTADAVVLNDRELIDTSLEVASHFLPKPVKDVIDQFKPIVEKMNQFTNVSENKRAASRGPSAMKGCKPKKRSFPKISERQAVPEHVIQLRNASPTVNCVAAVTKQLSYSDLETDRVFQSRCRATRIAFAPEDAAKRMLLWQLHGQCCTICSWVSRYMFSECQANDRLSRDDRKAILALHAWGQLSEDFDFCDVFEGLSSSDPPIFKSETVDLLAFGEYVLRNTPKS